MYSTYFQEWLSETLKPCILVYSSEKAKNSIKKNNLSPADFLRPLGDFTGKKIETPFIESTLMPFLNLQIDFYDNDKFKSIPKIDTQKYIYSMFKENTIKWDLSSILINRSKENILKMFSQLKYYSSKWIRNYEKTLFECLSFSEYELYQQPLINIFTISSLDEPSVIINLLTNMENIPQLISNQIYESPQENLIVILNDLSDDDYIKLTSEQKEENISKFKSAFKNYSIINWDINEKEKPLEENEKISEFYKKYFHRLDIYDLNNDFYRKKENIYGKYISEENIKKYKENFFEYFNFFIKNKLTSRINENLSIIQNNYGIKNFLSSFSILSRKEEINYYPNTKVYKFTEVEKAYYNLGLIYFYFHDYNKAFEYFNSLKGMLKEKSGKHKERIKELITICKYINIYNENEFDLVGEMISEGSLEQIIRNELIIIKMFENNEALYPMIENILNFIIATKQKFIKEYEKEDINKTMCFNYLYPLLFEKIGFYYISNNYFRKFQIFMIYAGEAYNSLSDSMKIYSLNCFSYLLNLLDDIDSSFLNLKLYYNDKLSEMCKKINYWDSHFKFSKNCFELLMHKNENKNQEMEENYLNIYLNSLSHLSKDLINNDNDTNVNTLEIPQINNSSLFFLEQNDYKIKLISEELKALYKKENIQHGLTWMEFNKYSEKLVENYYVYLIDPDLLCLKMLYDLSNRKLGEMVNIKHRKLKGNINQKLYVNINIKNPLTIPLDISSIKLNCSFYPSIKELSSENPQSYLTFSEENLILDALESKDILLTVESSIPGQMIINGLDFIFFKKCKINHLFAKKIKKRLYVYRPKYIRKYSDDDEVYKNLKSKNDTSDNNINYVLTEKRRRISSMYKKRKIDYEIKDLSEDLYISFPKGDDINVYLYQLILFPISITNNSNNVKIKRTSIFLENSDNNKIKTFFKYITKKKYINPKNNNEIFVIPFIPLEKGITYIKIIIKFEDEIRVKPVEIKRAMIKINVVDSINFELNEICNNFSLYNEETFHVNNFNIKTKTKISNNEQLENLEITEPIFNKNKYKLINAHEELKNGEIYKKYFFENNHFLKENLNKNIIKYNFDFINQELEKEKINLEINSHIIEKFNKIFNSKKQNLIFFPWKASQINSNKSIFGLYPYNIKLERPKATKNIIEELFYTSTKIEISKYKLNQKENLVIINLIINKSSLIIFNDIIQKYEIFVKNDINYNIKWIGGMKYRFNNNITNEEDEKIIKCKFVFITSLKGLLEINNIYLLLYIKRKKEDNLDGNLDENITITKPLSVFLD